jgi:hypothetical protein
MDLASRWKEPLKIQYQQTAIATQHIVPEEQEH